MASAGVFDDYRIGEGGPLRRLEAACHLTRFHWQIVAVLAVTWVPILILAFWNERTTGRREALLYDAAVHVRFLVAAPVFLVIDRSFPEVCRLALTQMARQAFVSEAERPRFERTCRVATRLSESSLPEALLVLAGVGFAVAALLGVVPLRGLTYRAGPTGAQMWYALVALPLYQFLFWRSLWRWAIWVCVLVGLSRLALELVPSHPDRCGGIAFLRRPSIGYCAMLLFAVSSVVCVEWGERLTVGATLDAWKPLLVLFGVVATLVAFGPLLLFAPQLSRARRDGLVEAGEMAAQAGRRFRRRCRKGLLENGELQGLAAMGQTYQETLGRVRVLLFDRADLIVLLVATLLPMVPVMLARVPRGDWVKLIGVLTGGRVG